MSERAAFPDAAALAASAFDLLLGGGELGLVWFYSDQTVVAAAGSLPVAVEPGEPIGRALPALIGLEARLEALKSAPREERVRLPNVAVRHSEEDARKTDIEVRWLGTPPLFLVVLLRGAEQAGLEVEIRREARARRIAESLLVEKSREVEVANKELARANRDLEEFAYVIAHDLKAPLRAIRVTADRLERDLAAIPEGQRASIALVRQQARRMSGMLSGLLEYSRVGRKKEAESEVDLRVLVGEIASTSRTESSFEIAVAEGTWPRFVTLKEPLDVVLRNLVENAVKHHDRAEGVVRLSCVDGGAHWVVSVEDDGPGIPPEYHAAVFEPFRRVNDDGSSEGSGIGLALVNKTVEIVGGKVELISDPATRRGSRFVVHWPKVISA